jgi:hypothetical protein
METSEHNSMGNRMQAYNSRDVRSIRNPRNVGKNTSGRRGDISRRKAAIAETTAIAGTPGTKQKETSGMYRTSGVIFFIDYCTAIRDT